MNIVPKLCEFEAEIRHLPQDDPQQLWDKLQQYIDREILPEMQAVNSETYIEWEELSIIPALATSDETLIRLAQELVNSSDTGSVSFGTEGGLFEDIGIPSVVCGPGHIDQAHKPNEFIEVDQVRKCEKFIDDLIDRLN